MHDASRNASRDTSRYAKVASIYDQTIALESTPVLRALFDEWCLRRPTGTFLDIGSGTGLLLHHAVTRGWLACGVEPSPQMRARSQERFAEPPEVLGSLAEVLDRSWDLVFAHGDVMNYLTEYWSLDELLAGIGGALADAGVFAGDFVTTYDILHQWPDCRNLYERPGQFRLEILHSVEERNPVRGGIQRRLFEPSAHRVGSWTETWVEWDAILGIEPSRLFQALTDHFQLVRWYDWESGGPVTAESGRIGFIVRRRQRDAAFCHP